MFNLLFGLYSHLINQPQFYFICAFFLLSTEFTDRLLYWSNLRMTY
jgi:hypothetical protein